MGSQCETIGQAGRQASHRSRSRTSLKRLSNSIARWRMALPISTALGLLLLIWPLESSGRAQADPAAAAVKFDEIAPASRAIHQAVDQLQKLGCVTPICRSVIRLYHIFDIVLDGEATTMGDARYFNPNQPYVEERRLHVVLLDHPNDFGPMCTLLTSLASRYAKPGAQKGVDYEMFVGVEIVDLAVRMDGDRPPHCLPAVLRAMPHNVEADKVILNAKDGCEGRRPIVRYPCARISRPSGP